MAALLSPLLIKVCFSPVRKVVADPKKPHGDAAQFGGLCKRNASSTSTTSGTDTTTTTTIPTTTTSITNTNKYIYIYI